MILGEANNIRHLRRFAQSHSRTPGFFFLSPEWLSCVRNSTLRKEKLARRAPENLSLGICSKILQMRNRSARLNTYRARDCLSIISNINKFQFVQATPHECAPSAEDAPQPRADGADISAGAA